MAKENKAQKARTKAEKNLDKRNKGLKRVLTTGKIGDAVKHLVGLAETLHGPGSGPAKKKLVVRLLNLVVDIPALNEATEAWVFDHAIDAALKALKL